ncbi:MAG: hypothetical protein V1736_10645 [Pseudomonadota bacterium]
MGGPSEEGREEKGNRFLTKSAAKGWKNEEQKEDWGRKTSPMPP